jgi:hypothetical protein
MWALVLDKWGDPSINPRTGQQRKMPLDGPDPNGNVRVIAGTARVMTAGEFVPADQRWRSHYATCPKAAQFRQPRRGGSRR